MMNRRGRRAGWSVAGAVTFMVLASASCGSGGDPQATDSAVPTDGATPDLPGASNGSSVTLLTNQGTDIVDQTGNRVVLGGVNLGGAWEWEAWLWGGGVSLNATGGTTDIQDHFAAIIGQASTATFTERMYTQFFVEDDIQAVKAMGLNVVRVPFSRKVLEDPERPGQFLASGWSVLDQVLAWCEKYGVYAVLDLHSAPGGQSTLFMADPEPTLLWDSTDAQDRTVALWSAVAARYASRDIVAGYDLVNEPAPPSPGTMWHDLAVRITEAIRQIDPRHLVIVEGTMAATNFSMFTQPIDAKMVYSFHDYSSGAKLTSTVASYTALAQAQGVPVWCGEFGGDLGQDATAAVDLFKRSRVAGWALWSWKIVGPQSWHLYSATDATSPNWAAVLAWESATPAWSGPKPTPQQLNDGIDELFMMTALPACARNDALAAAIAP